MRIFWICLLAISLLGASCGVESTLNSGEATSNASESATSDDDAPAGDDATSDDATSDDNETADASEAATTDSSGELSTNTQSSEFSSFAEKEEFVKRYIATPAEFTDTEFHITYVDNASGGRLAVPGPSDWDMRAVFKVSQATISELKSSEGLVEVSSGEPNLDISAYGPWESIVPDSGWETTSSPQILQRQQSIFVIYETEGIIYFSNKT